MRYRIVLAAAVLALALAGCQAPAEKEGAQALPPLKLAVIPVEDNFPLFVAEKEGLFQEAGLAVELVSFNSARDRDTALQAGQVDGEAADLVAAGLLRKGGTPVKVVSLTMGATPAEGRFALLSAPGSGISSPDQLKNVPVGVSEHTIIEYVADQLLRRAGLAAGEIKVSGVAAIPERLQLLLSGSLQAALLPDPFVTLAVQQGAQIVLDDTQGKENLSQVVMLFREEALRDKGDSVRKLLQVYGQAAGKVGQDPAPYRDLFVEKARIPKELKDSYLTPHYSSPSVPGQEDVQRVMDWMAEKGLLAKPFSYGEIVDTSFLPKP